MDKIKKAIDSINKNKTENIAFNGLTKGKTLGQSTGVDTLDYAIGCEGYPLGRVTEVYGLAGSAKTSLCLFGIAQAQRDGKTCMFVDVEYTFDIEHALSMGVDVENLLVVYPESGEEAIESIEKMLLEDLVDYIVVDSIPALTPIPELEAEINKPTMGGQARLIASALRRLVPLVAKKKAVLLLINQMRVNIMGGTYDPYITPGGMALKFYASVRIQLQINEKLQKDGEVIGQRVKFKMRKNKVGMNNDEGMMDLVFDSGFTSKLDLLQMATKKGVTVRNGNTYYFGEIKLGIGKEKANAFLDANSELSAQILQAAQQ